MRKFLTSATVVWLAAGCCLQLEIAKDVQKTDEKEVLEEALEKRQKGASEKRAPVRKQVAEILRCRASHPLMGIGARPAR